MAHEIYLRLDAVIGECQEQFHKNWIVIQSFTNSITGAGSGVESSGACKHGSVSISKEIDRSSPKLALAACNGYPFKMATIHVCQATTTGLHSSIVLQCILKDVVCSSYSLSGQNNSTDSIDLDYGSIEWQYTYVDPYTLTGYGKTIAKWDTTKNYGG